MASLYLFSINELSSVDLQFPIIAGLSRILSLLLLNLSVADLTSHYNADPTREIAKLYDMLDEQDLTNLDTKGVPFTVRSVFVIDPKKCVLEFSLLSSRP